MSYLRCSRPAKAKSIFIEHERGSRAPRQFIGQDIPIKSTNIIEQKFATVLRKTGDLLEVQ